MGRLYFVRHGQTYWNVENKICGVTDIALTPIGHEQAIQTANKIRREGIRFDEILTSPLIRAVETARHIGEITGVSIRVEERLKEQNFGKYEATARDGVEFLFSKEHFADRYEGGESMLQLAQRVYNLIDEIKADPEKKTYLLVAHNGIARAVESYFHSMSNKEYATFGIANCAIMTYEWDA
jgi:probable phosphoglycerate mutase